MWFVKKLSSATSKGLHCFITSRCHPYQKKKSGVLTIVHSLYTQALLHFCKSDYIFIFAKFFWLSDKSWPLEMLSYNNSWHQLLLRMRLGKISWFNKPADAMICSLFKFSFVQACKCGHSCKRQIN